MATPRVLDIAPPGLDRAVFQATPLVQTGRTKVVRLVLPAGKQIPEHRAPGDLVVHCLAGRVEFIAQGALEILGEGQMLHLPAGEPHSVHALENSMLLLTIHQGS